MGEGEENGGNGKAEGREEIGEGREGKENGIRPPSIFGKKVAVTHTPILLSVLNKYSQQSVVELIQHRQHRLHPPMKCSTTQITRGKFCLSLLMHGHFEYASPCQYLKHQVPQI